MDRFTSSMLDFFQAAFARAEKSRGTETVKAIRRAPGAEHSQSLQDDVSFTRFFEHCFNLRLFLPCPCGARKPTATIVSLPNMLENRCGSGNGCLPTAPSERIICEQETCQLSNPKNFVASSAFRLCSGSTSIFFVVHISLPENTIQFKHGSVYRAGNHTETCSFVHRDA